MFHLRGIVLSTQFEQLLTRFLYGCVGCKSSCVNVALSNKRGLSVCLVSVLHWNDHGRVLRKDALDERVVDDIWYVMIRGHRSLEDLRPANVLRHRCAKLVAPSPDAEETARIVATPVQILWKLQADRILLALQSFVVWCNGLVDLVLFVAYLALPSVADALRKLHVVLL